MSRKLAVFDIRQQFTIWCIFVFVVLPSKFNFIFLLFLFKGRDVHTTLFWVCCCCFFLWLVVVVIAKWNKRWEKRKGFNIILSFFLSFAEAPKWIKFPNTDESKRRNKIKLKTIPGNIVCFVGCSSKWQLKLIQSPDWIRKEKKWYNRY